MAERDADGWRERAETTLAHLYDLAREERQLDALGAEAPPSRLGAELASLREQSEEADDPEARPAFASRDATPSARLSDPVFEDGIRQRLDAPVENPG